MNKRIDKILKILFLILCILAFALFYDQIYYPSHISVMSSCDEITEQELNDMRWYVVGYYNRSNDQITILKDTPEINRHEYCHKVQARENRVSNCDYRFWRLVNEMECNIAEYLPNFIYNLKYK